MKLEKLVAFPKVYCTKNAKDDVVCIPASVSVNPLTKLSQVIMIIVFLISNLAASSCILLALSSRFQAKLFHSCASLERMSARC